jgi:PilZ domain
MVDRRRIARTRISTPALVIANDGSLVWKCIVRDITSLGARLEFQDAPVLPTAFNLTFDGKTLRRCHLKWRIANEVGVSFQTPEKDLTSAPKEAQRGP